MNQITTYTVEQTKQALIDCCIANNPKRFIPFLLSERVCVKPTKKTRFYKYFKQYLDCSHQNIIGALRLQIEKCNWDGDGEMPYYNFYDEVHLHERISIKCVESPNNIYIELPYF